MKTSKVILFLLVAIAISSCRKNNPDADPTSLITDQWWCDKAGFLLSQYFKSDGTWQQSSIDGTLSGSGKWRLSSDKKTIEIYDVADDSQILEGWEYKITKAEEDNLILIFTSFNVTMDMKPCD